MVGGGKEQNKINQKKVDQNESEIDRLIREWINECETDVKFGQIVDHDWDHIRLELDRYR